jgi:2'-5' RNA ligase
MRLFAAVDVSEELRGRIEAAVGRMRTHLDPVADERLAWVKPESWHITLVFIGELPESVATPAARHFAAPFERAPFRLVFGEPGLFPPRGRPRVLWVGVEEGAEPLADLQRRVLRRLDDVPFRRETRAFAPHLTLARVRRGSAGPGRDQLEDLHLGRLGGCTIDHVTLYRSHLSPKGARYEPLVHAPLG